MHTTLNSDVAVSGSANEGCEIGYECFRAPLWTEFNLSLPVVKCPHHDEDQCPAKAYQHSLLVRPERRIHRQDVSMCHIDIVKAVLLGKLGSSVTSC